jgi:CHASE1-domain containing sensor protein
MKIQMKKCMKKLILASALVLSISGTALAQQGTGRQQNVPVEQRVEQTTANLKQKVTLSEEQWQELSSVYNFYYSGIDASVKQNGGRPDRTKMAELKANRDEKLKAVVGEDNLKKILQSEAARQRQGGRSGQGGRS